MNELDSIIETAYRRNATDIHLRGAMRPRIRIDNALVELPECGSADIETLVGQIFDNLSPDEKKIMLEKYERGEDVDCAFSCISGMRLRANIYRSQNGLGAALRMIPPNRMSAGEIGLPFSVTDVCNRKSGLFLITGANGSGKTTTIAALLDIINSTRKAHVLTIEDPIEHVIRSRESLFTQREVGVHTPDFYSALRSSVRENPDIVVIGEMRDIETTRTAIELSETGHLVIASLHTRTAVSTIDRLIGQFDAAEQPQIRMMISENLIGVLTQTLLVKKAGGLIAAFEVLVANSAVRNLIREQKVPQIYSTMQMGKREGMFTMDDSLLALVESGTVGTAEALSKSPFRADLLAKMRASPHIDARELENLR